METMRTQYPTYSVQTRSSCVYCKKVMQVQECRAYTCHKKKRIRLTGYHILCKRKNRQRPEIRAQAAKRRRTARYNTVLSTASYNASTMLAHMHERVRKKHNRLALKDGQVAITKEFIIATMERQNHHCAICTYKLNYVYKARTSASPSMDRVDSNDTYHQGNVHITCVSCNMGKYTFDTREFKQVFAMGLHTPLPPASPNVRFHMSRKLSDAKHRGMKCTLTIDLLVNKVKQQGFRCYYTGIPLTFYKHRTGQNPRNLFYASVDRMDSNKGYTSENIVVCCMFFNMYKKDYLVERIMARWRHAVHAVGQQCG